MRSILLVAVIFLTQCQLCNAQDKLQGVISRHDNITQFEKRNGSLMDPKNDLKNLMSSALCLNSTYESLHSALNQFVLSRGSSINTEIPILDGVMNVCHEVIHKIDAISQQYKKIVLDLNNASENIDALQGANNLRASIGFSSFTLMSRIQASIRSVINLAESLNTKSGEVYSMLKDLTENISKVEIKEEEIPDLVKTINDFIRNPKELTITQEIKNIIGHQS